MKHALLLIGLMVVCPLVRAGEPVDRDNVVILLDGSGSMADAMGNQVKIDAAKQAIIEVLQTVPDTTQVGLLAFSEELGRDGWIHPLGPRDDAALLAALQPVRPGGGTPLGQYIKIAADRLLEQREAQLGYGSYRLLVVTDGQASDTKVMRRHVPEVVARGVIMDVIGVAMDQDHQLASLAHSYRKADDADSLRTALREVLGEVSGSGTDAADDDAFALLEGLPDGVADGVLRAFARGNNTPIGEDPGFTPGRRRQASSSSATPAPPGIPGGRRSGFRVSGFFWLVVAFVVGSTIIKSIRNR